MDLGLAGRRAVVTGGSRGIGFAVGRALAAEGAAVALVARNAQSVKEQADRLSAETGAQVIGIAADTGDDASVAAMAEAAIRGLGGVDILVNNAATSPYFGPMVDLDAARAAKTVEVNQFSIVLWTQLVWKLSMAERGGSIVNTASVGGMITEHGIGYYNATKAAVIHLTRQFAMELAPRVRVNGVAPGLVRTHLARALWEENEAQIAKVMPLGRIGEPEDIANAIVFLAGDTASWMTGQTIVIDGGGTIRPTIA
jgi:NAD(P)-dependent dehydrogenase (short-subunit alcohol dehydrogenase family)